LGGEEVKPAAGMQIRLPEGAALTPGEGNVYRFPEKCEVRYDRDGRWNRRDESFAVSAPAGTTLTPTDGGVVILPAGCKQIVPGSACGTFTNACTIPIALFVRLYKYKIRKGAICESSLSGA